MSKPSVFVEQSTAGFVTRLERNTEPEEFLEAVDYAIEKLSESQKSAFDRLEERRPNQPALAERLIAPEKR